MNRESFNVLSTRASASFRDFKTADIADVHDYTSDPEVTRWSTWGPNTLEQTTAFIDDAARAHLEADRVRLLLAAVLDGKLIGSVAVWTTDPHDRNGELGYTFHRAYWGNGYATEAVSQLLEFGFNTLHLERISATCHPATLAQFASWRRAVSPWRDGFVPTDWYGESVGTPCSIPFCAKTFFPIKRPSDASGRIARRLPRSRGAQFKVGRAAIDVQAAVPWCRSR